MKNLLTRTISGIVFVAIIIGGTLWTEWSFYALWSLVGVLCLAEFYKLMSSASASSALISDKASYRNMPRKKAMYYILGTIYIVLPIVLLTYIDRIMVVTLLTIVWANDTGAYVFGVTFGKHKMAPKISPKKSWEGFGGGIFTAIGIAYAWYALYWRSSSAMTQDVGGWEWIVFGMVIAIMAVGGDLLESKFKRHLGVKDSGNLIPGHGGMLDRFDATLLAVPFAWIIIRFIF